MNHVRAISKPLYRAQDLSLGHILVLIGQVMAVLAVLFEDKIVGGPGEGEGEVEGEGES